MPAYETVYQSDRSDVEIVVGPAPGRERAALSLRKRGAAQSRVVAFFRSTEDAGLFAEVFSKFVAAIPGHTMDAE